MSGPELPRRTADEATWMAANQRWLDAALAALRGQLLGEDGTAAARELAEAEAAMPSPSALTLMARRFALTSFERDLVLLCAGVELDASLAAAVGAAQGDPRSWQPTFGFALSHLAGAHWTALGPARPLRRFRLIEVDGLRHGGSLTRSPLRVDERVLHFIAGAGQHDERLASLLEIAAPADEPLVPSHRRIAARIAAVWASARGGSLPLVQLTGEDAGGKRAIAAAAAASAGLRLDVLTTGALTAGTDEELLERLLARESVLGGSALLVDAQEPGSLEPAAARAVKRLLERLRGPTLIAVRDRLPLTARVTFAIEVPRPTPAEQRALWRTAIAELRATPTPVAALEGLVEPIATQFDLPAAAIRAAAAAASSAASAPPDALAAALWTACRVEARPRLEELVQRLDPGAGWDDLVLPAPQLEALRQIGVHVRQRARVYDQWGFGQRGVRGLGVSALFAGASGTGKTMAAEVLARELELDLFRVDLSQVVSKYIGETEKNLRRVFDAAEHGGAILLFDEADALFGKRSEVRDSHDRYANIEVGYLLQRMEAYRGLAVLTTNAKQALDPAFLRRLRFVVQFPFPGLAERAQIWRRVFPPATPTVGLDPERLARFNVAGGSIRNIALGAAFLAADEGKAVTMEHVVRAAAAEYAKLERPLTAADLGAADPTVRP